MGPIAITLTSEWAMRNVLVAVVPFAGDRHTAENVAERTTEALKNVGFTDPALQVMTFISDNGSNVKKAWGDWPQFFCACHTLNLTVQAFLGQPGIVEAFRKGRSLIAYFHRSVLANNQLRQIKRSMGTSARSLTADTPIRWEQGATRTIAALCPW